jgi:hypothetical protein
MELSKQFKVPPVLSTRDEEFVPFDLSIQKWLSCLLPIDPEHIGSPVFIDRMADGTIVQNI